MSRHNISVIKIQEGIYSFLAEGLDIAVEDRIDLNAKKPYIAMADLNLRGQSARGLEGFSITQELLVFSNFPGKDETIEIIDKIRELVKDYEVEIKNANIHTQEIDDDITISQFDVAVYEGQLFLNITVFNH